MRTNEKCCIKNVVEFLRRNIIIRAARLNTIESSLYLFHFCHVNRFLFTGFKRRRLHRFFLCFPFSCRTRCNDKRLNSLAFSRYHFVRCSLEKLDGKQCEKQRIALLHIGFMECASLAEGRWYATWNAKIMYKLCLKQTVKWFSRFIVVVVAVVLFFFLRFSI